MWIVARDGFTIRELSSSERALLVGYSQSTLTNHEHEQAARILRAVRKDTNWIGCDCCKPMPLLNVALRESGTLVLRNHPNGVPHTDNCPLIKQETDSGSGNEASSHSLVRVTPDGHVALHREFSGDSRGNPQQISRTGASSKTGKHKKQLSLLLSIAESASLNEYDPAKDKTLSEQFVRIREAMTRYTLAPAVPALSFTDTKIDKRRITQLALKLRDSTAFGTHRKYGLLIDLVHEFKGRSLTLKDDQTVDFFGHVEKFGAAQAPYLVLATVATQQARTSFFELGHLALIPVLSLRTFFPVLNSIERAQITGLIGIVDWLYEKHKVRVIMRRQLFDSLNCLQFQGNGKLLNVDLSATSLGGESPSSILSLKECNDDLEILKKRVAKYFLAGNK